MSSKLSLSESGREIAERLSLPEPIPAWRIRRLFTTGVLPEPQRIAGQRIIDAASIPVLISALEDRGWLVRPVAA